MKSGTNPEIGLLILRVVLGVVFVAHGAPKLIGGVEETAVMLGAIGVPVPTVAAWLVALLETLGGVGLLMGLLVTPVSLLLAVHLLLGIILVHAKNGFYVVWQGQGGVEFNLVLIAGLLALVLSGPGRAALDNRRGA